MESNSLERASQYLNNLLLARGLLSNGKPIDFARPDRSGKGTDATMSRVINLVHDLVLRRDQDAEQREMLAMKIRAARADESQRVLDLQRLQDKNAELTRVAASAESVERALKSAARKAEIQAKELKDQMLKMKSTLDQVRSKCLSDVRKRDVELDKLKAHLAGLQRGKKDASGMKINVINWEPEIKGQERRNGQNVDSTEWSLEKETNDFLAALLNETSAENVSLRRIVAGTMKILSDLTGLSETATEHHLDEEGASFAGSEEPGHSNRDQDQSVHGLTSCAALADQMSSILNHCQSILRDPSFVPIEEVHIRDEEIIKLRSGWEKMATKWKQAVAMMDEWRKRSGERGGVLSNDDFSDFQLGKSVAMLPDGQPVFAVDEDLQSALYEDGNQGDTSVPEDEQQPQQPLPEGLDEDEGQESDFEIPPEPTPKRLASSPRRARLNIGKPLRPLEANDHNLNASPDRRAVTRGISKYAAEEGQDEENQRPAQHDEQMTMSVAEKLAAVEAEALEAQILSSQQAKKRKQAGSQRSKRATRRRSTLSPDELAALMGIE